MFLLILAFFLVLVTYFFFQFKKPTNYPPGPPFVPIIGNILKVKNVSQKLGHQYLAFTQLSKHFNTNVLGLKYGKDLTVVVHSYPLVKKVLTEEAFEGRPDNFFMRLRCMGTRKGITGVDGEVWHIQRNFLVKHLKNLGLGKKSMLTLVQREVADLMEILPSCGTQIKNVLAPSVINIFWMLTSGSRIEGNDPRIEKLIELLSLRSKAFDMAGAVLNIFPWLRFIAPKKCGYELICDINKDLNALFKETIEAHYQTWCEDKLDDLIYIFIKEIKKGSATYTDDQLVIVLLDLFIAGSQTTSTTLDFTFMMMVLRPDIQEKAQKYLDDAFDKNEEIIYSQKDKVPYIDAILMEVFRYFLIAPIYGPRRALHETELDGYRIPKNSTVLMNIYSLYYDKEYWKDPEEFRPERFIDENGQLIMYDHLIPYGLGRRRCLGDVLARNCLFIFFSEIIRKFKITLAPGSEAPSMKPLPGIILSPRPYMAQFTRRT